MVVKIPKACKNCGHVTDEDKCPLCGGETSKDWQGYVIIVDHQRSEIAKKMGIQSTGSSPSAFAEFADVTLRLPESLREYLRWPMGALTQGPRILPTIGRASP